MPIFRRNHDDKSLAVQTPEPYRWMQDMLRWDPFQEPMPTSIMPAFERTFMPAFEVKETKDGFLFKADLPGIKEADVDVKLTGKRLSITGKREAEQKDETDTYYTYERSYGSFQRTFALPDGIDGDHVRAELKNGELTVVVPKMATAQTKTVPVKAGTSKS